MQCFGVGANSVRPFRFPLNFVIKPNFVALRTGRRISVKQKLSRSPTHLCLQFVRRKIASLFVGVTLYKDIEKAVQSFYSDTALFYYLV